MALFVTCLVDLLRPNIGFAAAKLLNDAGFVVEVPDQTCCGQPNYNGGDRQGARAMAQETIRRLSDFEYVVVPSGSCAAMIKCHYPGLFEAGSPDHERAQGLSQRTHELTSFLVDVVGYSVDGVSRDHEATYHDGCSGLRELDIHTQPRRLLAGVDGLKLHDLPNSETCCGFGGLFCAKYPAVSTRIADQKIDDAISTTARLLIGGDLGCLLHLEGRLKRRGESIEVAHIAEVLAADRESTS